MFVPVLDVRVCVSALLGQCHMCMCNWFGLFVLFSLQLFYENNVDGLCVVHV